MYVYLHNLTCSEMFAIFFFKETITGLLKVTEYINEVQRVMESYIELFEHLLEESGLAEVRIKKVFIYQYTTPARFYL